jgi:ribosomal protein L40E
VSTPIPSASIEDIASYDIVLTDITNKADLSEKAHMAVAYVLFEDEIKRVSGGLEPNPQMKRQVQDEATRKAYEMAGNLPTTLKRSVRKKEALFFKERLAGYGVTVLLGYCPNCGGALGNMSDRCSVCGQVAIELGGSVPNVSVEKAEKPMLGETSSFCRKCGTLSQGEAEFCRKCGNQTGNPPAFPTPTVNNKTNNTSGNKQKISSAITNTKIPQPSTLIPSSVMRQVESKVSSVAEVTGNKIKSVQGTKLKSLNKRKIGIIIVALILLIFILVRCGCSSRPIMYDIPGHPYASEVPDLLAFITNGKERTNRNNTNYIGPNIILNNMLDINYGTTIDTTDEQIRERLREYSELLLSLGFTQQGEGGRVTDSVFVQVISRDGRVLVSIMPLN